MNHAGMVHALNELHRVLVPGGYLIDLRPFGMYIPVEIITGDSVLEAGAINSSIGYQDDLKASAAIEQVVAGGIFKQVKNAAFDLMTYWESFVDFKAYTDSRTKSFLPPDAQKETERLMAQYTPGARIRTRHNMIIGRYNKISN